MTLVQSRVTDVEQNARHLQSVRAAAWASVGWCSAWGRQPHTMQPRHVPVLIGAASGQVAEAVSSFLYRRPSHQSSPSRALASCRVGAASARHALVVRAFSGSQRRPKRRTDALRLRKRTERDPPQQRPASHGEARPCSSAFRSVWRLLGGHRRSWTGKR